ncbi:MAG: N-succinylarginine dihydrolase [Myxococcota bacterium]
MAREFNFDGLVGPSHHYGGLSFGNVASQQHEGEASNPRQAALQGLQKMRALHDLGIPQGVFPPHYRPELSLARRMGFEGTDAEILRAVAQQQPLLLAACYSASSMWTANAATVCPSVDAEDDKVHFTPANLQNKIHRSIEPPTTGRILRAVFDDEALFAHHTPLPPTAALGDEGAANHTRLAPNFENKGVHLFVYGETVAVPWDPRPKIFPARQTKEASEAICRLHKIPSNQVVLAHQNPDIIDQGVFHNDVISVGHRDVFFHHELAFVDTKATIDALKTAFEKTTGQPLRTIEVPDEAVPVGTAIMTYLFNSQLVTRPDGKMALVAPKECEQNDRVRAYVQSLIESDAPIDEVHYFDLRQSMNGGGGPACLRLRVELTDREAAAVRPGAQFSEALHATLVQWVEKHYRTSIRPKDLADPELMEQTRVALDELTAILELGSIYPFQLDA